MVYLFPGITINAHSSKSHLLVLFSKLSFAATALMKKYFTLLQKTLLYYRKLYCMKSIFSTKLERIKIHFSIRKFTIFFILI